MCIRDSYKQPVKVLYEAIKEYLEETADVRRVSLRAITEILGVSRSGFKSWLCRKPSESSKRRDSVKKKSAKYMRKATRFMVHQK